MQIKAVRGHGIDDDKVFSGVDLFEKIMRNESISPDEKIKAYPNREFMLNVFKFIKNIRRINPNELFSPSLLNRIGGIPFDLQALILCE